MPSNEDLVNVDRAFQVAWLVYINGVEVPCVSASTSCGVWQIPEAEIALIPDPILARLGAEDRVSVQIFYCDYWMEPGQADFRLMFDGEIVGWSYVNVRTGRAISFNCVDYVQIWTQLFFFFMSSLDDIGSNAADSAIGVTAAGVQGVGYAPIYPYSLFAQGIVPHTTTTPGDTATGTGDVGNELITRPVDFAYNIIRSVIDTDLPNRSVPGCNFFAPWTRRTNFHKRWVAMPYLETGENPGIWPILRAAQSQFAVSAVAQQAQRVGSGGSIWDMLQNILQVLMCEIAMIPTPAAVRSDYATLEIQGACDGTNFPTTPVFLTNYFIKPQFMFGIPPVCNVFYPSQIERYSYEENYITQPTRLYFSENAWTSYLQTDANASPGLATMIRDALSVAHPEEVNQAMRQTIEHPDTNPNNLLVYPEEFFKGPVVDRRDMPQWFLFLGQAGPESSGTVTPPAAPSTTESSVAPGDTDRDLFRLYAKYEYFKERYSRRTGALRLVFNPYPVPGFPCAIFDRRSTQIDTVAYVTNIRQSLHSSGWSTEVGFTQGRTFQEMFGLLQQQFTFENTRAQADQGRTINTVISASGGTVPASETTSQEDDFSQQAQPVGAIAMAPPEPIAEVRDVIQNFARAEAFYRTLFFRSTAPSSEELTASEITTESNRSRIQSAVATAEQDHTDVVPQPQLSPREVVTSSTASRALLSGNKAASFYYPGIIQLVDPTTGASERIQLEGLDSTSRTAGLAAVAALRTGTATPTQFALLAGLTGGAPIRGQVANQPPDPNVTNELNQLEIRLRVAPTTSNLRGDTYIAPQPEAQDLFDKYEAAMNYNARPICTLEEYIVFLGDKGVREGLVAPEAALAQGDSRTFPAPYYLKIRNYTAGPPPVLPSQDITNSAGITSGDGIVSTTGTAADTSPEATSTAGTPQVQGLPADFPETRYDWTRILLSYRLAALATLAPRS